MWNSGAVWGTGVVRRCWGGVGQALRKALFHVEERRGSYRFGWVEWVKDGRVDHEAMLARGLWLCVESEAWCSTWNSARGSRVPRVDERYPGGTRHVEERVWRVWHGGPGGSREIVVDVRFRRRGRRACRNVAHGFPKVGGGRRVGWLTRFGRWCSTWNSGRDRSVRWRSALPAGECTRLRKVGGGLLYACSTWNGGGLSGCCMVVCTWSCGEVRRDLACRGGW